MFRTLKDRAEIEKIPFFITEPNKHFCSKRQTILKIEFIFTVYDDAF